MGNKGIEAYPVGILANYKQKRLMRSYTYLMYQIGERNWRAVRNHFNGYLAEWHYPPAELKHYNCGKGWTKKRAIKRLGIHLAESNLLEK